MSRANGGRLFGPVAVAKVIDGFNYPLAFGRQTYEDSLFRSWAAGTSRPIRRMRHICRSYGPTCATVRRRPRGSLRRLDELGRGRQPVVRLWPDVVSSDGSGAAATSSSRGARRQLRPASDWHVRSPHATPRTTVTGTLATETGPGALSFSTTELTTARSDPTRTTLVRSHGRSRVLLRDDIPGRLLEHRSRAVRQDRGVLDRFATAGVLPGQLRSRPGRVLRCGTLSRSAVPTRSRGQGNRVLKEHTA